MENMKKIYRIGDKIENKNELLKISKGIAYKAIKVIATKGDKIAFELLEGKKKDLLEDIINEVATQIILNNYVISKNAYKCVRSYIYKENRDTIELIIDSDREEDTRTLNGQAYINYINNEYNVAEKSKIIDIDKLELTERQKEILLMYSKTNNLHEVARLLNINYQTVKTTIYRLKQKLEYLKEFINA